MIKLLTAYFLLVVIPVLAVGCGSITSFFGADTNATINKHAKRLADAYCAQPLAVRETDSRPRINAAISPHTIRMRCAGDPE